MPKFRDKRIWLTWEYQVRNRSMSALLNARLFEIQEDHRSALGRYFVCVLRTLKAVYKNKPDVVFHQNPSIFLGLTLLCLRPFFRFKMVTDTHNAGLYPAEGIYPVLNFLGRIVTKRTDVLIVHNQLIAADVKLLGCEPFVLADPLPDVIGSNEGSIEPSRIVFVCRWSADEPYQVVMRAFSNLVVETPDLELFITGKPPHDLSESLLIPQIKLTGFLANEDYAQLLHSSALMIVLTDRNNSLNCGAYEAAAFEKPCVLFDTKILKDFFGDAFIYAALDEESIANAMKLGLDEQQSRSAQMRSFKRSYGDAYLVYIAELEKIINM